MLAGAAALLSAKIGRAQPGGLTARQIVERIRAGVGVPWRETTVDGFKAGDPDTVVTGVATTVDGDARRAAPGRRGRTQPDHHARADVLRRQRPPGRPRGRSRLPRQEGVHRRAPAGRLALFGSLAGAEAERADDGARRNARLDVRTQPRPRVDLHDSGDHARRRWRRTCAPASASAAACASSARQTVRFAGSPSVRAPRPCRARSRPAAGRLILSGEPREWEAVEYVFDTAFAGTPKA